MIRSNAAAATLRAGGSILGPNLQIPATALVEMIALAGFDFVMLDGEHGSAHLELGNLILAADATGIPPLVRVPSHDRSHLLHALELGAGGVQVPMVDTAAEATRIVHETKYAPLGGRGFSTATRAAGFGSGSAVAIAEQRNAETLCIVQIETASAARNAAEIAAVPGVDVVFVGPADLAQSMGVPGRHDAPEVVDAIERLIADVRPHAAVGISVFSAEELRRWRGHGVQMFLTSSTYPLLRTFEALRTDLARGLVGDAQAVPDARGKVAPHGR